MTRSASSTSCKSSISNSPSSTTSNTPFPPSPKALVPVVWARQRRLASVEQLDVGVKKILRKKSVAVEQVDHLPHDLHVLLRHHHPSISQSPATHHRTRCSGTRRVHCHAPCSHHHRSLRPRPRSQARRCAQRDSWSASWESLSISEPSSPAHFRRRLASGGCGGPSFRPGIHGSGFLSPGFRRITLCAPPMRGCLN